MIREFRQTPALSQAKLPLRALACAVAFTCAITLGASAQTPQPTHREPAHHRVANPPAAQPAPPDTPPAPEAPPTPKWPANDPPSPPSVTLNSQGLHIVADNSSLSSILNQVSTQTGARVEGLSGDERVFGDYGPGSPREVLAQLFTGANYNVLILGDFAQGEPLQVLLSPRRVGGPSQPNGQPRQPEQDEDYSEPPQEEQQPQPYQPPVINRPPNQPMRPMTPQERMQEMQERQREFQQQQQQQQPQPQ